MADTADDAPKLFCVQIKGRSDDFTYGRFTEAGAEKERAKQVKKRPKDTITVRRWAEVTVAE